MTCAPLHQDMYPCNPDSDAEDSKEDEVEILDLDHDLGDFCNDGGDAIKLLDWLAERGTFYPVKLHTANPVGRANMERMLARYWK